MSNPPNNVGAGAGAPRTFTSQAASAEDLLKSQTVGLVHLDDFRKRRADVLEQKIKEAQDQNAKARRGTPGGGSGGDE